MEAKNYFKQPVFQLLAKELRHRYWRQGAFGTSVGLSLFAEVDTEPLRSFLGITVLAWDKKKRFKVSEFEQALQASILQWQLADFIEFVLKQPLVLQRDQLAAEAQALAEFQTDVTAIDSRFGEFLQENQLKEWQKKSLIDLTIFSQVSAALISCQHKNLCVCRFLLIK